MTQSPELDRAIDDVVVAADRLRALMGDTPLATDASSAEALNRYAGPDGHPAPAYFAWATYSAIARMEAVRRAERQAPAEPVAAEPAKRLL